MQNIIVQIYEVQDPLEAESLVEIGVDRIGSVIVSETDWKIPGVKETIRRVRRIKKLAVRNRLKGSDFFPSMTEKGRVYLSRAAVDRRFGIRHPAVAERTGRGIELVKTDAAVPPGRVFPAAVGKE